MRKFWEVRSISIITTHKVNCRDCFRCVRSCSVKAIGIKKGHARVIEERCILCGRCVLECPQQAKQVENQLLTVRQALSARQPVILSLAPSYISSFPGFGLSELRETVAAAGFTIVEETAVGAQMVSKEYARYILEEPCSPGKTAISSCCPAVVNLIERYYPDLINNLTPILSPMLTHAEILKKQFGEQAFVVFAGPCVAKIEEAKSQYSKVDAVLTFEQLKELVPALNNEPGNLNLTKENSPQAADGRYFPIAGGIIYPFLDKVADESVVSIDGIDNCIAVFEGLINGELTPRFIEAMACSGGCIGGPASGAKQILPARRNKALTYARSAPNSDFNEASLVTKLDLARSFQAKPINASEPSEEEVRDILKQTGKFAAKDEKNCGACGYDTCRSKAIAVFQGLAELEMCVPYMRSKAESFANIIVENSLNAIIAVNEKLIVKEFNPAVVRMFGSTKEIHKGMSLTTLFECADFVAAAKFGHKIVGKRVEYPEYEIITEQMIIPVPEHGLIIAIITDVTAHEGRKRELQQMKLETVEKATEIINKQMHVAQEIAGLLGETTAETKSALLELITLIKGKGDR